MQHKVPNQKFFKSKIDFAAPIKSLQHKGGTHDANLSDDSYLDNNHTAFRGQYNTVTNQVSLAP